MKAPSNREAATPKARPAVQKDQISVPAKAGSSLLAEHDFYEETCNNTPLAKLFQATNISSLVDKLCEEGKPWILPKEISRYFECQEFNEDL